MKLRERWTVWRARWPSASDWAALLGIVLLAKGGAEAHRPLAWIIPGSCLIAWAILLERRSA
jgi:hypothetical protein